MQTDLDIEANRKAVKYTRVELLRRVVWSLALPLFRLSPRPFFGWRAFLLRLFGAKIGTRVNIYSSATVYMPWHLEIGDMSSVGEHVFIYNLGQVTIGRNATISHRAHLCAGTHDYTRADLPLLKPPIRIGDNAWICADAFIGPDVDVGEGAIVAARAVAVKDVEAWAIVAGNPAKPVGQRKLESKS